MIQPKRIKYRRFFQILKDDAEKLEKHGQSLAKNGKRYEKETTSYKTEKSDFKMETYYYLFDGKPVACRYLTDKATGYKDKQYLCFGPNGRFCKFDKSVNYDPKTQKVFSVYRLTVKGEKSFQTKVISRNKEELSLGDINWVRCADACVNRVSEAETANGIFL